LYCLFLLGADFPELWRPGKSMLVLYGQGSDVVVHVDPGAPGARLNEPFYTALKGLSLAITCPRHNCTTLAVRLPCRFRFTGIPMVCLSAANSPPVWAPKPSFWLRLMSLKRFAHGRASGRLILRHRPTFGFNL